jgi:hypothetical protein
LRGIGATAMLAPSIWRRKDSSGDAATRASDGETSESTSSRQRELIAAAREASRSSPQLPSYQPLLSSSKTASPAGAHREKLLERRDVVEAATAFDSRHTGLSERASRIHASLAAEQTRTALQDAHSEALTALVRNRFVLRESAAGWQAIAGRARVAPGPPPPWSLATSIWAAREEWCDSPDLLNQERSARARFEAAWQRALAYGLKKHILKNYSRAKEEEEEAEEEEAEGAGGDAGQREGGAEARKLTAVQECLWRHNAVVERAFDYYASLTGGFDGTMSLNPYSQLIEDACLVLKASKRCQRSDLDRVFIAADSASAKIAPSGTGSAGVNRKNALSIDEFLHCLVHIATIRHMAEGRKLPNLPAALDALLAEDIAPNLEPVILADPNAFRSDVLYVEAVDSVLRAHEPTLRLLYASLVKTRGPAKRLLGYETWRALLRKLDMIAEDLTERDAALCFVWSRMVVPNPYTEKGVLRSLHLPFEGFLEAICRLACCKALPTEAELQASGCFDIIAFFDALPPAELEQHLITRRTPWGAPPRQPLSRCLEHTIRLITRSVSGSTKATELSEKECELYCKPLRKE